MYDGVGAVLARGARVNDDRLFPLLTNKEIYQPIYCNYSPPSGICTKTLIYWEDVTSAHWISLIDFLR